MSPEEGAELRAAHKQLLVDNEQLADQVARLQAQVKAAHDAEYVWKNAYAQASTWSYINAALFGVASIAAVCAFQMARARAS